MNRAGKIPFVVSGQGQEATQIGMAYALEEGDITAPYYRDLAFVTIWVSQRMIRFYQRLEEDDVNSGGKQMPSHFSSRAKTFCLKFTVAKPNTPCCWCCFSFKNGW
ncbi:thiamine pyrophosphate-dependent enzyme [Staphylococcus aureus]